VSFHQLFDRRLAGQRLAVLAIAALLGSPASACAQNVPPPAGPLATAVDAELRRRTASGWSGAVIIEYKGSVVLRSGYGLADRERNIAFTSHTIAQIGSVTKQFTAAAVVALAGEGRLTFTDSLAEHLPEVRGAARSVTLHELLTHSSGLPQNCGNDFDRLSAAGFLARCVSNAGLNSRGSYLYSNPGYSVLGIVVERVSGQRLEDYLDARFFRPLGLRNIAYHFPDPPSASGPAVCYSNGVAQRPMHERIAELRGEFWVLKGNGGMQASAEGMYAWYRALRGGKVIPEDARRMLMSPHVLHPEPGVAYGYGWHIRSDSAGRIVQVSHSGSDGVCAAAFVWRPIDDGFIYIVGNTGDRATLDAASALLRIMRDSAAQ